MENSFKLESIEQVIQFTEHLNKYQIITLGFDLPYINLVTAFENFQTHVEGRRIFTALLDLKLNYILLSIDLNKMGTENNELILGSNGEASIFTNFLFFKRKIEIHRSLSNFVPKYRAVWDKFLGIIILIYSPQNYNKYRQAKSRKKEFKKLSLGIPQISEEFVNNVLMNLEKFDSMYRTPEIHGTGTLRKWTFSLNPIADTDVKYVVNFANWLIPVFKKLDEIIETKSWAEIS